MKKLPLFPLRFLWVFMLIWVTTAVRSQRLELGSVNFAGFDLFAEAIKLTPPCNLIIGTDEDTLGVGLQPDGSYLIFRQALAGDLGGFGCAQLGEATLLLRVKGAGSKAVEITWQTIVRAQFDWSESCPCPPDVYARGTGTTQLALSFNLVNIPAGNPAVIRYTWTQICSVGSASEGAGEDSAFVFNRLRLANTLLYQDSAGTATSKLIQIGQKEQTGQIIASNGDSILLEIISRVLAQIEDPPIWAAFPEDDAVAESYGTLTLSLTGTVGVTGPADAATLEAPVLTPNPARDHCSIAWQQNNAGDVAFALTDAAGRMVASYSPGHMTPGSRRFDLDLGGFLPGIYVLHGNLQTDTGLRQFPPQRLVVVSR